MRWHTEECRHYAFQGSRVCIVECEQKWQAFVKMMRQDLAYAERMYDSNAGGAIEAVIVALDIDEEVSNDERT